VKCCTTHVPVNGTLITPARVAAVLPAPKTTPVQGKGTLFFNLHAVAIPDAELVLKTHARLLISVSADFFCLLQSDSSTEP
jgi:hypothetical protein